MDGVGIDHPFHHHHQQQQQQHQHLNHGLYAAQQLPSRSPRKRKAEAPPENNERLSKRLSKLNLEQTNQKLNGLVENGTDSHPPQAAPSKGSHRHKHASHDDNQMMQLDDTKYKVYIYNIDDELSSSDNEDGPGEGKVMFHPDVEKHLRSTRIPARVLNPGRPDEESSAGKELVLYKVPSSISIPEEHDSVRKAIMETRERARERQRLERERQGKARAGTAAAAPAPVPSQHATAMTVSSLSSSSSSSSQTPPSPPPVSHLAAPGLAAQPPRSPGNAVLIPPSPAGTDMFSGMSRVEDPDAMELD
ncbi:hypothetical protein VTH82DRAFT_2968 [Thermothelomyces myriococcoides]